MAVEYDKKVGVYYLHLYSLRKLKLTYATDQLPKKIILSSLRYSDHNHICIIVKSECVEMKASKAVKKKIKKH